MTILFDLDGTVIDSTEAILESFAVTFDTLGFPRSEPECIKQLIGHPLTVMFATLGVKNDAVEHCVAVYKEHYRTIANSKTLLLPGAKEAVETAARFAKLGVVTTKTGRYSKDILDNLGLGCYFGTIVGFEDVVNHKPHPEPIETALRQMRADRTKAWMIGDTQMDIQSAKAAGVGHVAVSSGYETAESLRKYALTVKDNVLDAVLFLKEVHR